MSDNILIYHPAQDEEDPDLNVEESAKKMAKVILALPLAEQNGLLFNLMNTIMTERRQKKDGNIRSWNELKIMVAHLDALD